MSFGNIDLGRLSKRDTNRVLQKWYSDETPGQLIEVKKHGSYVFVWWVLDKKTEIPELYKRAEKIVTMRVDVWDEDKKPPHDLLYVVETTGSPGKIKKFLQSAISFTR